MTAPIKFPDDFVTVITSGDLRVKRLRVPNGWIVEVYNTTSTDSSAFFLMDNNHIWEITTDAVAD